MKLRYRILLLNGGHAPAAMAHLLREADYRVTRAASYEAARRLLTAHAFDLLVTDVRLRGFAGLNLVMRIRTEYPDMALVVISGDDDTRLAREASRYEAVVVDGQVAPRVFLKTVSETLARVRRQRRWPRKRIVNAFRVKVAGTQAAVVDVSYGGMQLEVPDGTRLPSRFSIELTGIGLQLKVQPVWSRPSGGMGRVRCGAALESESSEAAATWRTIVDRLSA